MIGLTCVLAIAVNILSYALIGKTSAVTYQVVGHAKTCLVLIGGYVLVRSTPKSPEELLKNILGVIVAMVGVLLYSWFNLQESSEAKRRTNEQRPLVQGADVGDKGLSR